MRSTRLAVTIPIALLACSTLGCLAEDAYRPQPPVVQPSPLPPSREMEPTLALGSWRSTWGDVTIEPDAARGGTPAGAVRGTWTSVQGGVASTGYFTGNLRGNVLDLSWSEPGARLAGAGHLVFEPSGHSYDGRWWSNARDRAGAWNGWREAAPSLLPAEPPPAESVAPGPVVAPVLAPVPTAVDRCERLRVSLVTWLRGRARGALGPDPDPGQQQAADAEIAKWEAGFPAACQAMGDRLDEACFSDATDRPPHCRSVMRELMTKLGFR
jgi:hypothetical protein